MADRRVKLILEAQVDQFNSNLRRAQTEAEGLGRKMQTALGSAEMQRLGRHMTIFGAATLGALGMATKAAIDWETAWTDVMRRTEGTPQQLNNLEDALRGIATELPTTHAEVAAVAAAAAQLGVGVNDVEDFTRVMIDMGVSTNLTAEQAATAMARFANVMGTPIPDMDRLGSAIVDLGNNSATTESEIMDMAQRIAGAGAAFGMSEGEVLGFAAALTSVGVQSAAGGTAVSRMMYDINDAVVTGGDALQGFADVAGMASDEFAKLWQEDSASALEAFVVGLQGAAEQGTSVQESLAELGVTEQRTIMAFTNMAAAGDFLGDSLERGNQAWDENTALATEAGYVYDTVAAQMQAFWSNINDAAITIGQAFLPAMQGAVEVVGDAVDKFSRLPEPAQQAAGWIGAAGGAAALAAGSFILMAPGIAQSATALQSLGIQAPLANTAVRTLGRTIGLAIPVMMALGALDYVWDQFGMAPPDIRETKLALQEFADTGEYSGGITDFGLALNEVDSAGGQLKENMPGWGQALLTGFNPQAGISTQVAQNLNQELRETDNALAGMVSDGNFDAVAEKVRMIGDDFREADRPISKMRDDFPELDLALREAGISMDELNVAVGNSKGIWDSATGTYSESEITLADLRDRLSDTGNEALDAALGVEGLDEAMGEMGASAEEAADSMRAYIDTLYESGILTMSVRDAQFAFEETLRSTDDAVQAVVDSLASDLEAKGYSAEAARNLAQEQMDLGAALNDNQTDFNQTTDAGKAAQDQFSQTMDAGYRLSEAMHDNGATQSELQGSFRNTYDGLVEVARGFGMGQDEAHALTREILDIPPKVDIETWMSEEAKRVADETNAALDRVDGRHTRSNHTHTITEIRKAVSGGSTGSSIGGFFNRTMATGGAVRGPGTGTSDDIPAWLSNGEHVLTAKEVGLMGGQQGVYAFRRSLTGTTPQRPSGRDLVPTYATGGAVSRGSGGGGAMTAEASLVGARVEFGADGLGRFVDGRVKVSMGDPSAIQAASRGLADKALRDQRGTGGRRR